MACKVLLISTYEMGRQPFGLASPAAWLRQAGAEVRCLDLSLESLQEDAVRAADLVAFYVPMHMATRMAVPIIQQVRRLNPQAYLCCYGLYAPVSADYLRGIGVDALLGGEFEAGLVRLVERLSAPATANEAQPEPLISLERQTFLVPDRSGLPDLAQYAGLLLADGQQLTVGYTEASRGCKHTCRHCPVVPVYGGRFRVVQREVVLADIRQQIAAGMRHLTFGDPDFFNGPGHAIPLVKALHQAFPDLTYDVTIKVEHLQKYAHLLPVLKETGCLFITSAVESFDDQILTIFDKHHTLAQFETVLQQCRELELLLVPTFVAFTPWTTLAGYRHFLAELVRLKLVDQVSPIQCAIRLLIPPGSWLLERAQKEGFAGALDKAKLSYQWANPDSRVDALQADLELLVQRCAADNMPRREVFQQIWERAHQDEAHQDGAHQDGAAPTPFLELPAATGFVPTLTEPWYC